MLGMIELVSRPGCRYCVEAKAWLRREGVPFNEVVDNSGRGVPRLRQNGQDVMTGWNEDAWRSQLRHRGSGLSVVPSGSVSESVKEFFTTPAPPSELHRFGVTAAAGVASNLVVTKAMPGRVSPMAEMIAGVATIVAGHFVAKRWEAKSVGYGMLADGAYRHFVQPRLAAATSAQQGGAGQQAIVGGLMNQDPQRIVSEAEYLMSVEDGAAAAAASGSTVWRPPFGGTVIPTHIRLTDGSLLLTPDYDVQHRARLDAAITRGQARAARRVATEAITEDRYLARIRTSASYAARGLPEPLQGQRFETHVDEILGHPGTLSFSEYNTRFADRVARAQSEGAAEGTSVGGNLRNAPRVGHEGAPGEMIDVLPDPASAPPVLVAQTQRGIAEVLRPAEALGANAIRTRIGGMKPMMNIPGVGPRRVR